VECGLLEHEAIRLPAGLSCLSSLQTSCTSLSDPLGIKTLCGGTVLPPTENIFDHCTVHEKGMRFEMAETGNSWVFWVFYFKDT